MNEEVKEVIQENLLEDKEQNISSETDLSNNEDESKTDKETLENDTLIPQEESIVTQTILVDGKELDFYTEMYRETKVTNFLLQTILVVIPVIYICNKIYGALRKMMTVRF